MSKILVTGAAGFIGSHLSEKLLNNGHSVIGVDNFDTFYPRGDKEKNLKSLKENEKFSFVEMDLSDPSKMEDFLASGGAERVSVIVHLAAKAGVRPSIDDPVGYQRVNVQGTQNMLEFAKKAAIKQFVFASSSSVYGVNEDVPWREKDSVLLPISPYASTKVSGELLGHVYSHLYGIRFVGLRFFTVYGPRQRPDLAIHKFARLILEEKPIPFFGDGTTRRDYTYVTDIVDGIVAAISYEKTMYELINLGNNQTVSLKELVQTLETCLNKKATLKKLPSQPGDVPQTWADISKAQDLLSYKPSTSIREGIENFKNWLLTEAKG